MTWGVNTALNTEIINAGSHQFKLLPLGKFVEYCSIFHHDDLTV